MSKSRTIYLRFRQLTLFDGIFIFYLPSIGELGMGDVMHILTKRLRRSVRLCGAVSSRSQSLDGRLHDCKLSNMTNGNMESGSA